MPMKGGMCQAGGLVGDGLWPCGLCFAAEGWLGLRVEVMPVGKYLESSS